MCREDGKINYSTLKINTSGVWKVVGSKELKVFMVCLASLCVSRPSA